MAKLKPQVAPTRFMCPVCQKNVDEAVISPIGQIDTRLVKNLARSTASGHAVALVLPLGGGTRVMVSCPEDHEPGVRLVVGGARLGVEVERETRPVQLLDVPKHETASPPSVPGLRAQRLEPKHSSRKGE